MHNHHPTGTLARPDDLESRSRFRPHGNLRKADSSGVGTHDANATHLTGEREAFPSVFEITEVSPGKCIIVVIIDRTSIFGSKAAESFGAIGKWYGQ